MTCPACGSSARVLISPGVAECQGVVGFATGAHPSGVHGPTMRTGVCGRRYQVANQGGPTVLCECGMQSVGACVECGTPGCLDHLSQFNGKRLCGTHVQAAWDALQQSLEAELVEPPIPWDADPVMAALLLSNYKWNAVFWGQNHRVTDRGLLRARFDALQKAYGERVRIQQRSLEPVLMAMGSAAFAQALSRACGRSDVRRGSPSLKLQGMMAGRTGQVWEVCDAGFERDEQAYVDAKGRWYSLRFVNSWQEVKEPQQVFTQQVRFLLGLERPGVS